MYKSYIRVAFRHFWKDKTATLVNLGGLVIAFSSLLMIMAYIRFELSYDTTYSHAPEVYRCIENVNKGGGVERKNVNVHSALSRTLQTEFPEVESFTSFFKVELNGKSRNGEVLPLQSFTSDSNFFKVFNLPLVYGNVAAALKERNTIVLSQSAARKFFPEQNPVGQSLAVEGNMVYKVSGVMKDLPPNLHFTTDAIVPVDITKTALDYSGYNSTIQYILLKPGTDVEQLKRKLPSLYRKYHFPEGYTIDFQPVTGIHLHSNITDEPFANSDVLYVYLFAAMALLILVIACMNYVNLTTARSLQRTREVGVRKVLGAARRQVAFQFLTESFCFFVFALPVAFVLAKAVWPLFAKLLHLPDAVVGMLGDAKSIGWLLLACIVTGLLSGLYPAVFLSGKAPVSVLKGRQPVAPSGLSLRKALIVAQFTITAILIIATWVVHKQVQHISRLQLGFNKDHLLELGWARLDNKATAFKQELLAQKDIVGVSYATMDVGKPYGSSASMENQGDTTKTWDFSFFTADLDFTQTMQVPLLEGRGFSADYTADRINVDDSLSKLEKQQPQRLTREQFMNVEKLSSIIITRKTAELIGLRKPYAGQAIQLAALQGTVVGVVEDFKTISARQVNPALIIRASAKPFGGYTYIRVRPQNIHDAITAIGKIWNKYLPDKVYQYSFVDERLQGLYEAEQRLGKMFAIFTVLAISIASLGLFSLLALVVQQRTKEIGIRKVLGAGITNIVQLLVSDFAFLLLLSVVISTPISWWGLHKWLQQYESRTALSWWVFALSGAVITGIALLTISLQAIKAANANPVKSLRIE